MKKVLFIDRDGTIIFEPMDEQVDNFEELKFLPGAITSLARIARETDYELVMVTNQDGLGTESYPENTFWPPHNKMLEILEGEGVKFAEIFIDKSSPEDNSFTRKPGTAMMTGYLATGIDLASSYVIGDRVTDLELARNLRCRAIYISDKPHPLAEFHTIDWQEIYRFLMRKPRLAALERSTNETSIRVEVNLDGTGKSIISTGIGFFDHMLDQIAKHARIDLSVKSAGDLTVDEHHTIEDTAIALGQCVGSALGGKKGIERYGFLLPMDDSLAQVAIDFSGRPWLVWNVSFNREKIGDMPSEMFFHFFKSFSDNALCNLNIRADGENEHHKAEAIFKSFARALGMAVRVTDNYDLPSTKGKL
jgi:imidazoleglycerol-phosphate dehydratase / histidinol-phosphatase